MKEITGLENPLIKAYCKLKDRKRREDSRLFFFEGYKLLFEAEQNGVAPENILITRAFLSSHPEFEGRSDVALVSDQVYKKLSEESSPEGVFTVCGYLKNHTGYSDPENKGDFLLFLSSVRDPGNVGTILRAARAFGKKSLVISSDCADVYSSKTVRASMGAVFGTRTFRTDDLPKAARDFIKNGINVYAAHLDKDSVPLTEKIAKSSVFVLGNEGHGLSDEITSACS